MQSALLIIDLQNDFCPGGALSVPEGDLIVGPINSLVGKYHARFARIVASQDWHPRGHVSFASAHGKKVYDIIETGGLKQVLWPDHCIAGTKGAGFHPGFLLDRISLIIRKGSRPTVDSYSALFENDRKTRTGLNGYFADLGISRLFLAGLAFDYCVCNSAIDAAAAGFDVYVLEDLTRAVDAPAGSRRAAAEDMRERGVKIIASGSLEPLLDGAYS